MVQRQSAKVGGKIRHGIEFRVRQHLDVFRRQVERPDREELGAPPTGLGTTARIQVKTAQARGVQIEPDAVATATLAKTQGNFVFLSSSKTEATLLASASIAVP